MKITGLKHWSSDVRAAVAQRLRSMIPQEGDFQFNGDESEAQKLKEHEMFEELTEQLAEALAESKP